MAILPILAVGCGDADPLSTTDPSAALVARVEVSVGSGNMELGDSANAQATAFSPTGSPVALVDFVWMSSDPAVAAVEALIPSSQAVIRSVAVGTASLTARVGGIVSDPVALVVVEPEPADSTGT
jgi:hypothetical protein